MTGTEKTLYDKFELFPLFKATEGKTPAVPKGTSYTDPENLIMNTDGITDHQAYGLICGRKSGIMVLDIDAKDIPADVTMENLFQQAGLSEKDKEILNNTLTIKSPNEGYHLYFKFREGLRSTANVIMKNVDFRTEPTGKSGGYIISPFSKVRAKDGAIKSYTPIRGDSIQPMPEQLYQFILKGKGDKTKHDKPKCDLPNISQEEEEDPFQSLKGMKEGDGRNAAFNTILFNYCKKRGIRELAVMTSIAEKVQTDYFAAPEPGLMNTVNSVHQALIEEPDYTNFLYFEKGKQLVNTAYLAEFISHNSEYLLARETHSGTEIFYWYGDGYYRKMSNNEIKGKIKEFIPLEIRKAFLQDEVFKQLITNRAGVPLEDLNKIDNYINFKNGLFNVSTGLLEEHSPAILSTIQLNAEYKPDAAAPVLWDKYLDFLTNGDNDMKAILQEWTGLTISNLPGFLPKKSLALYGPNGNNGKTVFLNILSHLIGRTNTASRNIQDLSKNFGVSDLYGKKALVIDDQKESEFADSSIFKSITSGGFVTCEFKGMNSFNYQFRGTVTFGCNELPYLSGEKGSHVFERLIIIPCERVVPESDRDPLLFDKLLREMDGIILWALAGLKRLQSQNYKFSVSETTKKANEEYRAKSDSLYRFLTEKYIFTDDPKDRIPKTELEDEYSYWAFDNVPTPIHKKNIEARAAKIGIKTKKSSGRFYVGLRKRGKG